MASSSVDMVSLNHKQYFSTRSGPCSTRSAKVGMYGKFSSDASWAYLIDKGLPSESD